MTAAELRALLYGFFVVAILLAAFTWTVHLMSTPNEPVRYYNGDRSNFGKVKP